MELLKDNIDSEPGPLPPTDMDGTKSPTQPPEKCAICLGELVNKSWSNSCAHQFCFGCLLEWSKVKPECPLCKCIFTKIFHNIRSNSEGEYDEYHVPLPPEGPLTFANIVFPTRRSEPHFLNTPWHATAEDHGYSMARPVSGSDRDQQRRRFVRIFEMGMTDFDSFMSHSAQHFPPPPPNPFLSNEPEYFGNSLQMANSLFSNRASTSTSSSTSTNANLIGYQTRKRIYDRGQWVNPFNSTLQPGTVFFPSVEYFRTHPQAFNRLSPWLHRELQVLLGLRKSQTELAHIYNIIVDLVRRYDIRSREFSEMLISYLVEHTRQFAHEFYHFVLSGMPMAEYDRVATYSGPRPSRSSTNENPIRTDQNPFISAPQIITLSSDSSSSSDDEEGEDFFLPCPNDDESNDIIILDDDSQPPAPPAAPPTSNPIENEYDPPRLRIPTTSFGETAMEILDLLDVGTERANTFRGSLVPGAPNLSSLLKETTEQGSHCAGPSNARTTRATNTDRASTEELIQPNIEQPRLLQCDEIMGLNSSSPIDLSRSSRPPRDEGSSRFKAIPGNELNSESRPIQFFEGSISVNPTVERPPRLYHPCPTSSNSTAPSSFEANFQFSLRKSDSGWQINQPLFSSSSLFPPFSSSGSTNTSTCTSTNAFSQGKKVSPEKSKKEEASDSDSELEYLGQQPVVKKPPLAIITISDSEEEEEDENVGFKIQPRDENQPCTSSSLLKSPIVSLEPPSSPDPPPPLGTITPPPYSRLYSPIYSPPSPPESEMNRLAESEDYNNQGEGSSAGTTPRSSRCSKAHHHHHHKKHKKTKKKKEEKKRKRIHVSEDEEEEDEEERIEVQVAVDIVSTEEGDGESSDRKKAKKDKKSKKAKKPHKKHAKRKHRRIILSSNSSDSEEETFKNPTPRFDSDWESSD